MFDGNQSGSKAKVKMKLYKCLDSNENGHLETANPTYRRKKTPSTITAYGTENPQIENRRPPLNNNAFLDGYCKLQEL